MAFLIHNSNARDPEYPAWRHGLNAALNVNFTGIGFQNLSPDTYDFIDKVQNDGIALAPYISIFSEYNSESWWGIHLRMALDWKNLSATDPTRDPESKFDISNTYLLFEPMLEIDLDPIDEKLYAYLGPEFAFHLSGKYDYYRDKDEEKTVSGAELTDMVGFTYGMMFGLTYDILLSNPHENTRYYISPFIETSWIVNQREGSFDDIGQDSFDDILSTVAIRVGARAFIEFADVPRIELVTDKPFINLSLTPPPNSTIRTREVIEFMPLVNYVFFDKGNPGIPDRYIKLPKAQAASFSEKTLLNGDIKITNFSDEQLFAYYNILNIYGDRLRNSKSDVTLIGSAPEEKNGIELANAVKQYLVERFDITPSRIKTEGVEMPAIPSGSSSTLAEDKPNADIENRRVEFKFSDSSLYRPVELVMHEESSIDNDLIFNIVDNLNFKSWHVDIIDEEETFSYGPYEDEIIRLDPVPFMGNRNSGRFTARIELQLEDGRIISEERDFELIKLKIKTPARRYTVLFNYGQADAIRANEKFLRNKVASDIIIGSRVIIHGHTDNIGNEQSNLTLSRQRAKESGDIILSELNKLNRKVDIRTMGFGEDTRRSFFKNDLPEGRHYNRSVILEIIPLGE